MTIAIGADHGGFEYKEAIKAHLLKRGIKVLDLGTNSNASVHYPLFGIAVGEAVRDKKSRIWRCSLHFRRRNYDCRE